MPKTISLQTRRSGRDLVENVRELCGTDLHVISSQLGKDSPAVPDLLTLIGLDDGVPGARGGALRVARRRLTGGASSPAGMRVAVPPAPRRLALLSSVPPSPPRPPSPPDPNQGPPFFPPSPSRSFKNELTRTVAVTRDAASLTRSTVCSPVQHPKRWTLGEGCLRKR